MSIRSIVTLTHMHIFCKFWCKNTTLQHIPHFIRRLIIYRYTICASATELLQQQYSSLYYREYILYLHHFQQS